MVLIRRKRMERRENNRRRFFTLTTLPGALPQAHCDHTQAVTCRRNISVCYIVYEPHPIVIYLQPCLGKIALRLTFFSLKSCLAAFYQHMYKTLFFSET